MIKIGILYGLLRGEKVMTKQEQIEKMAEDVVCSAIVSNAKIDDKVAINLNKFVENMIRLGYRKIDDDCAVITKDELKQYKEQAVKEFAEKLKNNCSHSIILELKYITENRIDELLKEY